MTSRFILNKFDLDLSSSRLLVGFGLFLVFLVVTTAFCCIVVVDKRIIPESSTSLCLGVGIKRGAWCTNMIHTLTLAHAGRGRRLC